MTCTFQNDQLKRLDAAGISSCRITQDGKVLLGEKKEEKGLPSLADSIIHCHPEGLFSSDVGATLLETEDQFGAIVVDECHVIERWYLFTVSASQMEHFNIITDNQSYCEQYAFIPYVIVFIICLIDHRYHLTLVTISVSI